MSLVLYTWTTPNGRKISIMLEELGLPYDVRPIDIGRDQQFAPEFLRISPNNKIPALIDEEAEGGSLVVFESGAILTYLAEKTGRFLAPSGAARYAAMEWLHWSIGGLGPMVGQLNFFSLRSPEKAPLATDRFTREADRLLGVMDRRLSESAYLGGGDYSIADMAAYTWTFFVSTRLDHVLADSLASKPAIYRWLKVVGDRPAVRRGMLVPEVDDEAPIETIASLKQRIKLAEEECDALRGPGQEELYLQACSLVEALELQLEERLRQAVT
jgi:GST-like protein